MQTRRLLLQQVCVNHHQTAPDYDARREEILQNLLRMELREAARNYLTRTRGSYPIHSVYRLCDSDFEGL